MDTRQLIGWGLLALVLVLVVGSVRFAATSQRRQRARERREFDRHAAALVARDDDAPVS